MEDATEGVGGGQCVMETVTESTLKLLDKDTIIKAVESYIFPGFPVYSDEASIRLYGGHINEEDLETLKNRGDFSIDGCKPEIEISSTTPEGFDRKTLRLTYHLNAERETFLFNRGLREITENIAKILGRQLNCTFCYNDHHLYGSSGYFLTKFKPK